MPVEVAGFLIGHRESQRCGLGREGSSQTAVFTQNNSERDFIGPALGQGSSLARREFPFHDRQRVEQERTHVGLPRRRVAGAGSRQLRH